MSETLSRDGFLDAVVFDADGLVPVIAQDHKSGAVLMLAWMNRDTLEQTLQSGEVTYWSRSRNEVWRKGATSGHTQKLIEAAIDCDGDALLLKVDQTGPACHTGSPVCFYRRYLR
jgi:phosphoribosyl-AMP cyclohydrolase